MNSNKRILVNVTAQYTRTIINTLLSLYTVRLVLEALGQEDYGLYGLVFGVVGLLGFITNAMVITTQRQLSFRFGQGDMSRVRQMFSNSVLLHLALVLILSLAMGALTSWLINGYLSISPARQEVATIVYLLSIGALATSFITAPFKALFIARENIVYISCIDIMDGVLKLLFVLFLLPLGQDKLLLYAVMMLGIFLVQLLAYVIYAVVCFSECAPRRFLRDYNREDLRQLLGFAGWTTYGTGAVVVRTQGLQILFNKIFQSTVINAAYTIALQAYSSVAFVASSVMNAMNPQIMKAEGEGDRARMLRLAEAESKFITAIMAVLFVPLIVEMPSLLGLWLKEVPAHTVFLCDSMLLAMLVDQLTMGLHTANQAIGRIRLYTLLMYTPKVLVLPLAWLAFFCGGGIEWAMGLFVAVELLTALMRIPFLHYQCGLSVGGYLRRVVWRILPLCLILPAVAVALQRIVALPYAFLINIVATGLCGLALSYYTVLTKQERHALLALFARCKGK